MTNEEYMNATESNEALTKAGFEIMKLLACYDDVTWNAKNELETKLLRVAAKVKDRQNEIGPNAYAEFTRRFREVRKLINYRSLYLEATDQCLFVDVESEE